MRKTGVIIALLLVSGLALQSCKRCRTCKYTYTYTGISETVVLDEVCGSKAEVDAYRDQAEVDAEAVNGTVTCVDN